MEEGEEEWGKEEGSAEGVLPPEEDREDEVATGEEAVRGSDGRKSTEEKTGNSNRGWHANRQRGDE